LSILALTVNSFPISATGKEWVLLGCLKLNSDSPRLSLRTGIVSARSRLAKNRRNTHPIKEDVKKKIFSPPLWEMRAW
jgi:hypothetical protein